MAPQITTIPAAATTSEETLLTEQISAELRDASINAIVPTGQLGIYFDLKLGYLQVLPRIRPEGAWRDGVFEVRRYKPGRLTQDHAYHAPTETIEFVPFTIAPLELQVLLILSRYAFPIPAR